MNSASFLSCKHQISSWGRLTGSLLYCHGLEILKFYPFRFLYEFAKIERECRKLIHKACARFGLEAKVPDELLHYTLLAAFLLFLAGFWNAALYFSSMKPAAETPAVRVEIWKAEARDYRPFVSSSGKLEYYRKADIVPRYSGSIKAVFKDVGDSVKKGEPLVKMDSFDADIRLLQAKAEYHSALSSLKIAEESLHKAEKGVQTRLHAVHKQKILLKKHSVILDDMNQTLEGKKRLLEAGALSRFQYQSYKTSVLEKKAEFLAAKSDLDSLEQGYSDADLLKAGFPGGGNAESKVAFLKRLNTGMERARLSSALSEVNAKKADLKAAQMMLSETLLRSPIDGVIAARNRNEGDRINGGEKNDSAQAVLVVVDSEKIFAPFSVREKEIRKIKAGQEAQIIPDGRDEPAQGRVATVSPLSDFRSHTVRVRVILENSGDLMPGSYFEGRIFTSEPEKRIFIPESSVLSEGEESFVFAVTGEKVAKRRVSVGSVENGMIEIVSGLVPGESICRTGVPFLKEGSRIEVSSKGEDRP